MMVPALDNRANDDPVVDCKSFPDSITCHECNSFGPGTWDCCFPRPGHGCIIINDPNEFTGGKPPRTRFSQSVIRHRTARLAF